MASKGPPTVIFTDPDIVVASITEEKKWLGPSEWVIRYGPRKQPTKWSMRISPNSRSGNAAGGWKAIWPE